MSKMHYFDQPEADANDMQLGMAKLQGYVPGGCLLGGMIVMAEVSAGRKPCWGCAGPRDRCQGAQQRDTIDD